MQPIKLFLLEPTGKDVIDGDPSGSHVVRPEYRRSDTGALCTVNEAGVGAVFEIAYFHQKGPDGKSLAIFVPRNPDGSGKADWWVDQKGHDGQGKEVGGWTRTGTIPEDLWIAPSIHINPPLGFHGFVKAGYIWEADGIPSDDEIRRLAARMNDEAAEARAGKFRIDDPEYTGRTGDWTAERDAPPVKDRPELGDKFADRDAAGFEVRPETFAEQRELGIDEPQEGGGSGE